MLGLSADKLIYNSIQSFSSPADYLDYLFGGVEGVVYRATIDPKYYQSYYRASGLIKARYWGVDNCYVSMNTFYRTKGLDAQDGRAVALLKRLNALYVDIDCYKVGLSKREVLLRLEEEYIDSRIPAPTFIVDSGRGIYLIWKLRNEDKNALPRWTAVQQYLTDTLTELGADQACTDAARVLRVPFSKNPKSNSVVSIVEFNDLTYSIYDIAKEYDIRPSRKNYKASRSSSGAKKYPYNHATERMRKYVRDIASKLDIPEAGYPDFTDYHETDNWIKLHKDAIRTHRGEVDSCHGSTKVRSMSGYRSMRSILGSYCAEIRKLFAMRKGANCKRELALFLYRYFLREMKFSSEKALEETLAFNASLDCPFEESYVTTVTASADRRIETGVPYAYKKSTIINILDISEKELESLPFLASGVKSQKERNKEKNRRAYESRLAAAGKDTKKDAVLKRRASILSMKEQGYSPAQIQEALHISHATYHRDNAALAVTSVLEAARAILSAQAELLKDIECKAVEAVSEALERVSDPASFLRDILNKVKSRAGGCFRGLFGVSHIFNPPFIREYSVAVPHGLLVPSKQLLWFIRRKYSGGGDDSGGEGAS